MKSLNIGGADLPLGNIFCIGRNYSEHAKELGNAVPEEPVVFLKPTSALALEGAPLQLPAFSTSVHYECEIVVVIGKDANRISPEEAASHIGGFALGLDLTARDIQDKAKAKGLPWTKCKGFRQSACLSRIVAPGKIGDIGSQQFQFAVNGAIRQQGNTADMIFSVPFLISYLSDIYGLQKGDIIYTGTPAGVGELHHGDRLELLWPEAELQAHFDVA